MTWGELRKSRARSRSSERLGVGVVVVIADDDDACSAEESGGGVSIEGGSGSDGAADGCGLSSSLAVIARLVPVPRAGTDTLLVFLPFPLFGVRMSNKSGTFWSGLQLQRRYRCSTFSS